MIKILSFMISLLYSRNITDTLVVLEHLELKYLKKKLEFLIKKFYTYGYEYYSIGMVIRSKKIKFTEVPVTMQYPKQGSYSK